MSFNQRLRLLFVLTGDTQQAIAFRTKMEANRISKWVHGQGEPGPEQVGLLAEAFGVDPSYFFLPVAKRIADAIGLDADRIRTVERPHKATVQVSR